MKRQDDSSCDLEVANEAPSWGEFLRRHPDTTIYHNPLWGKIMHQAYGNLPFYLTSRRDGEITGILQLIAQNSALFGRHLCSLPYFDVSGVLAQDDLSVEALLKGARDLLEKQRARWIELRHLKAVDVDMPTRSDKVTLHLPLVADADELWNGFKAKVRNQVRKAQRDNVKSEKGGPELLKEFYTVYLRNMRDLGSPPHSYRFFRLIIEHFPAESQIYLMRLDGKAIAASFTLSDKHALRVPWAASDWRLRNLNANMLLYWSMLSDGCQMQVKCFDFGRSTLGSGTHKFKSQWGASDVPLIWQFLLAPGETLPILSSDSDKYQLFIKCWKRLPVWVSRWLGPKIIARLS